MAYLESLPEEMSRHKFGFHRGSTIDALETVSFIMQRVGSGPLATRDNQYGQRLLLGPIDQNQRSFWEEKCASELGQHRE